MSTEIEPYKLSEIFSLIPEYDGDQILLNTFINACNCAHRMCIEEQRIFLTLHIKNKLSGKAAQLINSRDVQTWVEIRHLLTVHFGDSRDLTSLIQDLQRIHQLPNESPLTFVSRLQTHNAKMYACIQQQNLSEEQKTAQEQLIESMSLNTLLTGLEPKLGQIIRASNPPDILTATIRIRRELQLSYFEKQKFNKTSSVQNQPQNKKSNFQKTCSYCKKSGHLINECRFRQSQYCQNQQSQNQNNNFQRNFQYQPNFRHQNNQMRPQHSRPIQNQNQVSTNQQRRNFHMNSENENLTDETDQNQYENESQNENFQPIFHLNQPPGSQIKLLEISEQKFI